MNRNSLLLLLATHTPSSSHNHNKPLLGIVNQILFPNSQILRVAYFLWLQTCIMSISSIQREARATIHSKPISFGTNPL